VNSSYFLRAVASVFEDATHEVAFSVCDQVIELWLAWRLGLFLADTGISDQRTSCGTASFAA